MKREIKRIASLIRRALYISILDARFKRLYRGMQRHERRSLALRAEGNALLEMHKMLSVEYEKYKKWYAAEIHRKF